MSIWLAAAVGQAVVSRQRVDHTEDVAVVATFLTNVRSGTTRGDGIEVKSWVKSIPSSFASFAAYANECQLERINAVPSATRKLPIGVEWDCGRYLKVADAAVWEERVASFWIAEGRVVRVSFGNPPPVIIPPVKAKTNG